MPFHRREAGVIHQIRSVRSWPLAVPRVRSIVFGAVASAAALLGLYLVIGGYGILVGLSRADGSFAPAADWSLATRAYSAVAVQLLVFGVLLVLYLASFLAPAVRGFWHGTQPWAIHFCWALTAFLWIGYAVFGSLLVPNERVVAESLRLAAPLGLAACCLLQGTALGSRWRSSRPGARRLAAMMAGGFLLLALVDVSTTPVTNSLIERVDAALRVQSVTQALERTGLPATFPLTVTLAKGLSGLLAVSPWVLIAIGYGATVFTAHDLPDFFRTCPRYASPIRAAGRWMQTHIDVVYAWLPLAAGAWLVTAGASTSLLRTATGSADSQGLARALELAPLYLVLLLPVSGFARGLASSAVSGMPLDTDRRNSILRQIRWPTALFLLTAGLTVGNLALWANDAGWPAAVRLNGLIEGAMDGPMAARAQTYWFFVLVAFVSILVHYLLTIELPYYRGQARLKKDEIERSRAALDASRQALADSVEPAESNGAAAEYAGSRLLARFTLAQEELRRAESMPLHTVRSGPDLVRKLITNLGASLLLPLLHQGSSDPVHGALGVIWEWLTSVPASGG